MASSSAACFAGRLAESCPLGSHPPSRAEPSRMVATRDSRRKLAVKLPLNGLVGFGRRTDDWKPRVAVRPRPLPEDNCLAVCLYSFLRAFGPLPQAVLQMTDLISLPACMPAACRGKLRGSWAAASPAALTMRIRAPASCKQGMSGGLCRGRNRGPPAVKGRVPGKGRHAEKDCLASQVHRVASWSRCQLWAGGGGGEGGRRGLRSVGAIRICACVQVRGVSLERDAFQSESNER